MVRRSMRPLDLVTRCLSVSPSARVTSLYVHCNFLKFNLKLGLLVCVHVYVFEEFVVFGDFRHFCDVYLLYLYHAQLIVYPKLVPLERQPIK